MRNSLHHIHAATVFADDDFPLAVMRIADHRDIGPHDHAFHELVLIKEGTGRHVTEHGSYPLHVGDVFLIRDATRHGYTGVSHLHLVNILFEPKRLHLPLSQLDLGAAPGYHALFRIDPRMRQAGRPGIRLGLSRAQRDAADEIVKDLEEELRRRQPGCRFMACSHLMRLIGYLSRCHSDVRTPGATPGLGISRALGHMDQHVAERLSVAQLAHIAGMSESSFLHRFHESVGNTPIRYLNALRIRKACDLLRRDTSLPIQEVAMQCGFDDGNYFSRRFRQETGRSPRVFRAAARLGA